MESQWNQEELETRYQRICERLAQAETDRINGMLAPQFVKCSATDRTAVLRYEIKEWEKNQRNEAHGGAIGAMFDTAMGMSVGAFWGDRFIATTDLQISYIRPFSAASYLFYIELVHMGRTLTRVAAKALEESTNRVAATAVATFICKGQQKIG